MTERNLKEQKETIEFSLETHVPIDLLPHKVIALQQNIQLHFLNDDLTVEEAKAAQKFLKDQVQKITSGGGS